MKNNIYLTYALMLLVVMGLTAQNKATLTALPYKKPTLKVALFYTDATLAHYSSKTGTTSGFQVQLGEQIRAYQNAVQHSGLDYHVTIVSNTLISPTTDIHIETLLHYTQPNVIVFLGSPDAQTLISPNIASVYRSTVVSVDAIIQNPLAMATALHQAVTHTTLEFVAVPYKNTAQKGAATADKTTTSKNQMPAVSFSEHDKTAFICDMSKLNLVSPDTAYLSQSIRQTQTQSIIDVTHTMLITPDRGGATTLLSFDEGATDDNFLVFSAEAFTAMAPQCSHEVNTSSNTSPSDDGDADTQSTASTADNNLNGTTASIPAAQLLTPYPNPTTDIVNIPYMVERESLIHLTVYDNTGRLVESLVLDEAHATGTFNYKWDTREINSGVYLCFLEANGTVERYRIVKR